MIVWIHHTDTTDGWKEDIIRKEPEHLERIEYSDGFETLVDAGKLKAKLNEILEKDYPSDTFKKQIRILFNDLLWRHV